MIGLFTSLKSLIALNKVRIDNGVFVLHYKVTVIILLVSTMLISCKQHFGEPITCLADREDSKFGTAIDAYCWVHPTYTVNELLDAKIGTKVLRPGVGQHNKSTTKKFHQYYQWVGFFLLFQAWMFYFPRVLWKAWEGGRMHVLSMNLKHQLNYRSNDVTSRRKAVSNYLLTNFHRQNPYAMRYMLCELFNCINVLGQIALTDLFLGFEFSNYGKEVMEFITFGGGDLGRSSPMDKIFPKLTKCTFNQFGPSGNIVPYDVICVLPMNVLNEKIFVFLWFWFLLLAIVSLVGFLYRIVTLVVKSVRKSQLKSTAKLCHPLELQIVSHYSKFGDWFILQQLGENIDPLIYSDVIKDMAFVLKKYGPSVKLEGLSYFDNSSDLSDRMDMIMINDDFDKLQEPLYDIVNTGI